MRNAFVATRIETIVRELVPVRDSLGEHYFQEARAIDTDLIADILERVAATGWHPSVLFREEGHSLDGERLGRVVGVMTDPVSAKTHGRDHQDLPPWGLKVGQVKALGSPVGIVRLSIGSQNGPPMQTEPHRLVFIDETGTNTKMTRARGRCERGERLRSKAPFGHWKTQTFVAGLRCGALTAP
jgi:hypothetical protein